MKVKKAIIPAAGLGTRFLPITKSIPKEMFPIINKPSIQFIIDECINSQIEEVIIVLSSNKKSIIDFFCNNKSDLNGFNSKFLYNGLSMSFIEQKEALGLGHAIKICEKFINNEPFAVLLPDDVIFVKKDQQPAIKQLIDIFYKKQTNVIGVQNVDLKDVNKYGIIDVRKIDENIIDVRSVIEKPNIENSPSQLAIVGRYVFMPNIFYFINKSQPNLNNELELTSAIQDSINSNKLFAKIIFGNRYDIGSKIGLIKSLLDVGLNDEEISKELKEHINKIKSDK